MGTRELARWGRYQLGNGLAIDGDGAGVNDGGH